MRSAQRTATRAKRGQAERSSAQSILEPAGPQF